MKILGILMLSLMGLSNLNAQQCVQNPIIVSKDTVDKLISDVAKAEAERVEWSKEIIQLRQEMNAKLDSLVLVIESNKCVPIDPMPSKKNVGTFLKEWGPYITSGFLLVALIYHHNHVHKDLKDIKPLFPYPVPTSDDDDDND